MPRQYVVTFEGVAVTAAQDLFQITGAAGKIVEPVRVIVKNTDTTLPTAQMLEFRMRFLPATVTNGSGGTTPTIYKTDNGDAAASFTALVNNTTKATTSGTAVILYEGGEHVQNGLDEFFDGSRIICPPIGPSEALVVELLSTVTGTVHLSGTIWLNERGG
jgi:hypothetical protein